MPTYEFKCIKCGKTFSLQMSFSEFDLKKAIACPYCKSEDIKRVFSNFTAVTSRKS
ncbi:MAG: zinc ribbon domain-containing protein [Ignavibacteriaceae bacterium]|nr:zinc ribbon domain-containing protein [Ignavibacteriaceae bacterium]